MIDRMIRYHTENFAPKLDVPVDLVLAIILTESSGRPHVTRYEPRYSYITSDATEHAKQQGITLETEIQQQKFSYGLMQIMGGVARELGYTGPLVVLIDVPLNIEYGIKKLRQLMDRHGDLDDVIASYNAQAVHGGTTEVHTSTRRMSTK